MKVVCLGDSITFGQHLDRDLAWPSLLRGYEVTNAGVPGDTTRLGLERFPRQVQVPMPDAVIIQFGHNDANRWDTDRGLTRVYDRGFTANLEEMIFRSQAFDIVPFLVTMTPTRRSQRHAIDCGRYNNLIREVAAVTMTTLIDVRPAFFSADEYVMADGLHLTEAGHVAYAEVVQQALDAWSKA